jgi:hypothetical protein
MRIHRSLRFPRSLEQSPLAARRRHGYDPLRSQFGSLFDHPFKAVELEQRRAYRDVDGRRRRIQRFDHPEDHALSARFRDLGKESRPIVGDLELLPHFYAEHARQVARFVTAQFRHSGAYGIHKEPSSGQ